ncbi:MAG: thiamine phosphate synthase [Herminiimonas sp.]|nr:thiamine phosphate synthase [Herminiimonas sp.]MDB5855268.1 thiamine phosphate synthase [Herminiimonas sp.]
MKGLYVVTPDWNDTEALLASTEAALRGGAVMVQYRHKTASPEKRVKQAEALLALCRRYQRPFIINDHVQLALELDADGVHVGGTDASVAEARAALGPDKIVGASCYGDLELARKAHREGATHVAFGGFYPSRVKKYEVTTSTNIIAQSKAEIPLPVVVIGGMTVENSAPLVAAGADMVAAISSVYLAAQPEEAARGFQALWSTR